jgi:hypothetical protein
MSRSTRHQGENGVWACNDSLTNSFSANSLLGSDILLIFASDGINKENI